ncbi:MAG: hypothetical protein SGARI_004977, partial [Bacillariaceae sp.]
MSVESRDALVVEYSDNTGETWNLLKRIVMGEEHGDNWNSACHESTIVFSDALSPLDPSSIDMLQLRIRADANHKRDFFFIDDIRLEGIIGEPPMDRDDICPLGKTFPSQHYEILPFPDMSDL